MPLRTIPGILPAGSGLRDQFRFHVETFRHGFAGSSISGISGIQMRVIRARVLQDHARIAVALALHRSTRGSYPETLDTLSLPLDPFTGVSYLYRPSDGSDYLLYSPGPDRRDDGGSIRHHFEDGDWVWRLQLPEDFNYDVYRSR